MKFLFNTSKCSYNNQSTILNKKNKIGKKVTRGRYMFVQYGTFFHNNCCFFYEIFTLKKDVSSCLFASSIYAVYYILIRTISCEFLDKVRLRTV
jgi:hypothetical protein